jgi:hypothetical protein
MFFDFHQNNSGGSFSYDDKAGIAETVIVEAASATEANEKAERVGLYFDGDGDCRCCGNRWYELWSGDEGTAEPLVYGKKIAHAKVKGVKRKKKPTVYIHYTDGRIEGGFVPGQRGWREGQEAREELE